GHDPQRRCPDRTAPGSDGRARCRARGADDFGADPGDAGARLAAGIGDARTGARRTPQGGAVEAGREQRSGAGEPGEVAQFLVKPPDALSPGTAPPGLEAVGPLEVVRRIFTGLS